MVFPPTGLFDGEMRGQRCRRASSRFKIEIIGIEKETIALALQFFLALTDKQGVYSCDQLFRFPFPGKICYLWKYETQSGYQPIPREQAAEQPVGAGPKSRRAFAANLQCPPARADENEGTDATAARGRARHRSESFQHCGSEQLALILQFKQKRIPNKQE